MFEIAADVWVASPNEEISELHLRKGCVLAAQLRGREVQTRHIAGINISEGEGPARGRVVPFDAAIRGGINEYGRVCELTGDRKSLSGDANYTWNTSMGINAAFNLVDATDEILQRMRAASGSIATYLLKKAYSESRT